MTVRWIHGEPSVRTALEAWLRAPDDGVPFRNDAHRRVARIPGTDLVVKQFRVGSGRHPLRERLRARFGAGPAEREWRALLALSEAGAPVPRPVGLAELPGGDRAVVTRWVSGTSFVEALSAEPGARRALLVALGAAVAAVHARGFRHGDLHVGNVIVGAAGPILLDLQRARRGAGEAERLRDLAHLDHSLAAHVSTAARLRVRLAALGIAGSPDAGCRERLRRVGAASLERQRAHFHSRLRHARREGRAFVRAIAGGARGLRARTLSEEGLAAALAAHDAAAAEGGPALLDRGARSVVCAVPAGQHRLVSKEVRAGSLTRAVADALRGSPARRAWAGGHGLRFLAAGAPEPLAYLEWRRLGLPVRSLVLLEDLRPDEGAHLVLEGPEAHRRAAALDALLHLLLRLHRAGVDHGDLKASNVLLRAEGTRLVPRLVDLEGVRFRRRLPDARRRRALAQLNASVGDALEAGPRRRFFDRYVQALPFAQGRSVKEEVVRESLARRHRWTGRGCGKDPAR